MKIHQDVLSTLTLALTVVAFNVILRMNIKCALYDRNYRSYMLKSC